MQGRGPTPSRLNTPELPPPSPSAPLHYLQALESTENAILLLFVSPCVTGLLCVETAEWLLSDQLLDLSYNQQIFSRRLFEGQLRRSVVRRTTVTGLWMSLV